MNKKTWIGKELKKIENVKFNAWMLNHVLSEEQRRKVVDKLVGRMEKKGNRG